MSKKKHAERGKGKGRALLVCPYVLQMALVPLPPEHWRPCIGGNHIQKGKSAIAPWEGWCYQDEKRYFQLLGEDLLQEEIIETLWQETLREQERGHAVIHSSMPLCGQCAGEFLEHHIGHNGAMLCLIMATVSGQVTFLLTTEKQTEQAGVFCLARPLSRSENVLEMIARQEGITPIRLKETEDGET